MGVEFRGQVYLTPVIITIDYLFVCLFVVLGTDPEPEAC